MTTRDDVVVDFDESPRIIEVAAPSTEMGMQDLVDTIRVIEEGFMLGLPHDKLLDASGKQDLGDGVLVGITVDLDNAQLSFEPRRTAAAVGTVTTGSGTPIQGPLGPTYNFVDTGADFVSAGVKRGSLAINFTDNSVADVIEVVSATELRTRVLVNGTNNTWQIGDDYHIFNIIQCNATGGNLVARDDTDTRITSVFPTAFVQVVRTASSSATLQEQQDIQYASYGGGVTVDLTSLYSGTAFPVGTPRQPVNNFTDALAIAAERGFDTLYIKGDATFGSGLDFSDFNIIGESPNKSEFTIDASANVNNCEFSEAYVQGTLDGGNVLTNCSLGTINFVDGFIKSCILNDTITLSTLDTAHFLDCFSGVPGLSTPTINMGGAGSPLAIRNYNGGIRLQNKTGTESVSIDMNSGQIILDDTVTDGTIVMRGVGTFTNRDTYAGGATIVDQLITVADVQFMAFQGGVSIDPLHGSPGTEYPAGTTAYPVDNLADAIIIAADKGFHKVYIHHSITVDSGDWTWFEFIGHGPNSTTVTFTSGATTDYIIVRDAAVTGEITGVGTQIRECRSFNLTMRSGAIKDGGIQGTITLSGPNTEGVNIIDCYSISMPTIDLGGNGPTTTLIRFSGSLALANKTAGYVAATLSGANMILQNTLTGGTLLVGGQGTLQDLGATMSINNTLVTSDAGIVSELNSTEYDGVTFDALMTKLLSMATGKIVESPTGTFKFYEQDNTTVAFTLTKSGSQRLRS